MLPFVRRLHQRLRQTVKTGVVAPLARWHCRWNSSNGASALPEPVCEDLPCEADRACDAHLLLTTKTGVVEYQGRRLRRLLTGNFYGLTRHDGRWYAFHRASEFVGQIISFVLPNQKAGICDVRREVGALHPEIHQIDFCDGRLYVADPGHNRLLCYPAPVTGAGRPVAAYPNGRIWRGRKSPNYVHLNSVVSDGDTVLALLHNLTNVTGRKSELVCLDGSLRVVGRQTIDAGCAHNIVVVDGRICYCDSQQGDFVAGTARLRLGSFTRGVAVAEDVIYVGGSDFAPRSRRENSNGLVYCCSRDGSELYGTLALPNVGGVYEVRLASGVDQASSDYHRWLREAQSVRLADIFAGAEAGECVAPAAVVA
ncbi:MAG: hypothetical protein ACT4QC_03145 [Planctomycetaceae bacterium]